MPGSPAAPATRPRHRLARPAIRISLRERNSGTSPKAARPPALGVRADRTIVPAIPGMILDISAAGRPPAAHRLFAPLEPHSTGKRARTCESCHRSSVALGLGTGTLDLEGEEPGFTPRQPTAGNPPLA